MALLTCTCAAVFLSCVPTPVLPCATCRAQASPLLDETVISAVRRALWVPSVPLPHGASRIPCAHITTYAPSPPTPRCGVLEPQLLPNNPAVCGRAFSEGLPRWLSAQDT